MINMLKSMLNGNYLGVYSQWTIVKGIVFPLLLYITKLIGTSYSSILTLIDIGTCLYFVLSLKKLINNKIILLIIFFILLFNPVSYSSELFQRLYRNALSIPELLLFLGTIIRIICLKENNIKTILYYILLGIISSLMYLTREDNIWIILGLTILLIYKLYTDHKFKSILINLIPILIIYICLNTVSYINYKHYNTYTYNELSKSEFKNAYVKILKIKDDEKKEKVAIPKSTWYKLVEQSKAINLTKEDIDEWYEHSTDKNGEISNSNIIWKFRDYTYNKFKFKDGNEANKYFHKLSNELDELYKKGIFKKEWGLSSVFMNPPTFSDIIKMPKSFIKVVTYTTSYKDIKTIANNYFIDGRYNNKMISIEYDHIINAYRFGYSSSHKTGNIVDKNPFVYEIIRNIYKYLTIILSIPCLVVYFLNIKKKDELNLILHIILISYLIILGGVVYTHVTAFDAIRYCYLGNIYILQNIFILLNIIRLYENKKKNILIRNEDEI